MGTTHLVDKLHLATIPDEVLEWAVGKRASFSPEAGAADVRVFVLGERAA